MLVETVCYWAVPVFLMLSGANLMGYRDKYSTAEFFKKRFVHMVIPFVAWSLINAALKGFNLVEIGWQGAINHLFLSKFENVYWFFIPLFAVYLAMPVLSLLRENRRILWYMVGGAFLLQSTLPALFRYAGLSWNGSLSMLTMGGYLDLSRSRLSALRDGSDPGAAGGNLPVGNFRSGVALLWYLVPLRAGWYAQSDLFQLHGVLCGVLIGSSICAFQANFW